MAEKKRCIIVHRWDGTPDSDWYSWLKKELVIRGFNVVTPKMPNTSEPKIEEWVSHLKKIVGVPDENTYFIGHSIGCQAIMRYLETLPKGTKIAGVIFVAGWFALKNLEDEDVEEIARPWLTTPINFSRIKDMTSNTTVFLSTNDYYNCVKENESSFKNNLGAKVIILKDRGHFTADDGITELLELLEEITYS